MAAELLLPTARASDTNNSPYSGAQWFFYVAGTSTPQAVYADALLETSLGATVTADSAGKFVPIYFDASLSYRGVCKNASGSVTLHDISPINNGALSFLPAGDDAAPRSVQDKLREFVSIKDFGAVGTPDASALNAIDDTAPIQAAIDYCAANRIGTLYFPSPPAGSVYMVTAPLTVDAPIRLVGPSEHGTQLMAVDFSADTFVVDFDCDAGDNVEHAGIEYLTIRSLDGVPDGLRVKNVGNFVSRSLRLYGLRDGLLTDGTRCFSHSHYDLVPQQISRNTVRWPAAFAGGGQFNFYGGTMSGSTGVQQVAGAYIDGLNFFGTNFEGCTTNSMALAGTVAGGGVFGGRTEGCLGVDFVLRPFGSSEFISGFAIDGTIFGASNAAAAARISVGGDSGKVRGCSVDSTVTTHSTGTFAGVLVNFNGAGSSMTIENNVVHGTNGTGAGVVSGARAGVKVFNNENLTGPLAEYDGLDKVFATATIALAAGATNVMQVTITAKDHAGAAIAEVQELEVWVSEAATGIGLTADSYSGDLVVGTGSELQEIVSKKHYKMLTDVNGVIVFTITATTEPADQYIVVKHPRTGKLIVSAASGTNWG